MKFSDGGDNYDKGDYHIEQYELWLQSRQNEKLEPHRSLNPEKSYEQLILLVAYIESLVSKYLGADIRIITHKAYAKGTVCVGILVKLKYSKLRERTYRVYYEQHGGTTVTVEDFFWQKVIELGGYHIDADYYDMDSKVTTCFIGIGDINENDVKFML
jgi:hypothetical protein